MIRFFESLDLTNEAREGLMELIFGQLEPFEAINLNKFFESLSEEALMMIVLRNMKV